MVDYSVDENFDFHFNGFGDFETVSGREEFQEDLLIAVHYRFGDIIGGSNQPNTIAQKVELLASRIAESFEIIDSIKRINVYELEDKPESLRLEVIYRSGGTFEETL